MDYAVQSGKFNETRSELSGIEQLLNIERITFDKNPKRKRTRR